MALLYKKKIYFFLLLIFSGWNTSVAQQTIQLYQEDFNAGLPNIFLNTGGPSSNSGPNQWIINNNYNGGGLYPNTPDETQVVSGTIAGAPFSNYLHIYDTQNVGTCSNANYNPAVPSDNFAQIGEDVCTYAMENTILTFFWIGEGNFNDYCELYYSLDGGGTWTQTGSTQYNNQNLWKYEIVTDPIFDNQPTLRFGWRWKNMGVGTNHISMGIDDIFIVSTYDNINNPVNINITSVAPNPVCASNYLSIFYSLSAPMCDGTYEIELSNSAGNFTGTNLGVFSIAAGTTSGGISGIIPAGTPIGNCYKVRITRLSPPPAITGTASICFQVINCPNTITTLQPVVTFGPDTPCVQSVIDVPFYSTGTFNANNQYVAQLSDVNGNFGAPLTIGTFPSSQAFDPSLGSPPGNVSGVIPVVPDGCNYYIRVISTSPSVIPPPANYFGPFCIHHCDNTTNNITDIHVCITDYVGVDTTITIGTNSFPLGVTYNPGNQFQVQIINSMTYQIINTGAFGTITSMSGGTMTLSIPGLLQVIATLGPPGTGMYYMRLIATNCNPPGDSLGTLIHLIIGSPDSIPPTIIPDDTLVCAGAITSLTIAPYNFNSTYQWYSPVLNNGQPFYWSYNPLLIQWNAGTPPGNYWFTVRENNYDCFGTWADTVHIHLLGIPNVNITAPTPVCQGDTVHLTVPFQVATYYQWWSTWGTVIDTANNELYMVFDSTGTVQVHVFALNPCGSANGVKNIIVQPRPSVVAINDTTVCKDVALNLSAISSTGNYNWKDEHNVSVSTNQFYPIIADSATYYIVMAQNSVGCKDYDTVNIDVWPLPNVGLGATEISCPGMSDGTAFSIVGGSTPPYMYLWNTGATTTTLTNIPSGNYSLVITDANGCLAQSSIVIIEPLPIVLTFDVTNTDYGMNNGSATALVAGGTGPYTYVWDTNPISYSQTINGLGNGTYHVTVTDSHGCTGEGEVVIDINGSDLFVPNTFSPNGDGENDLFQVFGRNLETLYLRIYDRWGEMVYETRNPKLMWNGKFHNEDCAMGVYVYYIQANFLDGTSKFVKGNLTLIR